MWTNANGVGGGVGNKQDVHKRVYESKTQESYPSPLSPDVRIAKYVTLRTFARDTIRMSVDGMEGAGCRPNRKIFCIF